MSHVVKIEAELNDIKAIKAACIRLGWEFRENQKTYQWYGRHVGDYPMPEGMTKEDLGKCDHAIHIPGVYYEAGLVRTAGGWKPIYDFYDHALKQKMGGIKAEAFMQAYAIEKAKIEAKKKNLTCIEQPLDNGKVKLKIRTR